MTIAADICVYTNDKITVQVAALATGLDLFIKGDNVDDATPACTGSTEGSLAAGNDTATLGEFLAAHGYSGAVVEHYVVPMTAAIWSAAPGSVLAMPARFLLRFFANHGMLSIDDRPVWRTVRGGSARYVEKLTAPFRDRIRLNTPVESVRRLPEGVMVKTRSADTERFDQVFFACHSDEALAMLAEVAPHDGRVLAGGQSLVPTMAFRLARPAHLVDINGIEALRRLSEGVLEDLDLR